MGAFVCVRGFDWDWGERGGKEVVVVFAFCFVDRCRSFLTIHTILFRTEFVEERLVFFSVFNASTSG